MSALDNLLKTAAVFSSTLCWVGGGWIFYCLGAKISDPDNGLTVGIALYLLGKGCFVGPMLLSNIRDRKADS